MKHVCKACNTKFHLNSELQNHSKTCYYFNHTLFKTAREQMTTHKIDLLNFIDYIKNEFLRTIVCFIDGRINTIENKMKVLEEEVKTLKMENTQLRTRMNMRVNKNIADILNKSKYNGLILKSWLFSLEITNDHFHMVYEEDLTETIKEVFMENMKDMTAIPIRAFIEKKNVLYYYNGECWQIVDKNIQIIYVFVAKLGMLYNEWCMGMEETIDPIMEKRSFEHLNKITMNQEKVEKNIREWLYQKLKQPIYEII